MVTNKEKVEQVVLSSFPIRSVGKLRPQSNFERRSIKRTQ